MKRGFSLVEMLIVVIIIGILATIAVPVFSSMSDKSKIKIEKDNLMALQKSLELYAYQNDVFPKATDFKNEVLETYGTKNDTFYSPKTKIQYVYSSTLAGKTLAWYREEDATGNFTNMKDEPLVSMAEKPYKINGSAKGFRIFRNSTIEAF